MRARIPARWLAGPRDTVTSHDRWMLRSRCPRGGVAAGLCDTDLSPRRRRYTLGSQPAFPRDPAPSVRGLTRLARYPARGAAGFCDAALFTMG